MTYFPAASVQTTVNVSKFRDAIGFAGYCARKVASPSCTQNELICERSQAILSLFRAMRELQAIKCNRLSQDDRDRLQYVFSRSTELVDEFRSQYFEIGFAPSSEMTDEELYQGFLGSEKADELTTQKFKNLALV